MKVLITGKDGQASLAFADLLARKGDPFLALSRKELDITDLKKVRKVIAEYQPEIVFNGAAYNAVDKAEDDWETAFLVNGIGPRNLAIACEETDIPLVTFSTDYVFDGKKGKPYTIADEPNPINAYGRSKLLGERFVQSLCRKYILARVSWVFGIKGKTESNFLKKVLKWAETNDELRIVDDQISSPTYAPDLAEAVYSMIEAQEWGLCHLTNTGYCSRYEWIKYLLSRSTKDKTVVGISSSNFSLKACRPFFSALTHLGDRLQDWKSATSCYLKTSTNKVVNSNFGEN